MFQNKDSEIWITFFLRFFKCHLKKRKKSHFLDFQKNVKTYSRTMSCLVLPQLTPPMALNKASKCPIPEGYGLGTNPSYRLCLVRDLFRARLGVLCREVNQFVRGRKRPDSMSNPCFHRDSQSTKYDSVLVTCRLITASAGDRAVSLWNYVYCPETGRRYIISGFILNMR